MLPCGGASHLSGDRGASRLLGFAFESPACHPPSAPPSNTRPALACLVRRCRMEPKRFGLSTRRCCSRCRPSGMHTSWCGSRRREQQRSSRRIAGSGSRCTHRPPGSSGSNGSRNVRLCQVAYQQIPSILFVAVSNRDVSASTEFAGNSEVSCSALSSIVAPSSVLLGLRQDEGCMHCCGLRQQATHNMNGQSWQLTAALSTCQAERQGAQALALTRCHAAQQQGCLCLRRCSAAGRAVPMPRQRDGILSHC